MSEFWTLAEVEAAVSDYLDMLAAELRGDTVNKADHNRRLRQTISSRSKGSIERKHQNISAVLIEIGYPYISGYKPLGNYQDLLRKVVEERVLVAARQGLDDIVTTAVSNEVLHPVLTGDVLGIEVPAPRRDSPYMSVRETAQQVRGWPRKNYLEMEAHNKSLGLAGERLVLEFEHKRLWTAGQRGLADRIEHVAQTQGDHLGFDIHSFEEDGRERLIEVKTTRFGVSTPFFVSSNEVNVSNHHHGEYHLYRVFDFTKSPRMFRLKGSLHETCRLKPTEFMAAVG